MNKEMLREELLVSFQRLQRQFDSSMEEAKRLDDTFITHYQASNTRLSTLLRNASDALPKSSPLSQSLSGFIKGLEAQDKAWEKELKHQANGLNFRSAFEDSLLVYIYGKVKSGKSSLGNYMAWGYTNPTPEQQQTQKQQSGAKKEYSSHGNTHAENGDKQNEAGINEKFRVGATEATSSIQSFRLPGLTWVDSPGLHSVRAENGELAKKYADHADLILYTMSSDAPGRASDLKEIRALCDSNKNIMLLITGSDTTDDDWDDEKNELISLCVMKTPGTRKLQREEVKKELQEAGVDVSKVSILSLSARYAELNADDPEKMKDSGMSQLFATLYQISQDNGVRIKRDVPMTNFKNFLTHSLKDVETYKVQTASFRDMLDQLGNSIPQRMLPEIREAQSTLRRSLQDKFDTLSALRDDEYAINTSIKESRKQWDSQIATLIACALETILADVMREFKSSVTATWRTSSFSLPDFSIEKVTEQIPADFTKSTRKRNSGLGGLLGGAAGIVFGPLGVAIGASAGAALGAALGNDARLNTRSVDIAVGDNLNELRSRIIDIYSEVLEKQITLQVNTQFSDLLERMRSTCGALNEEIESFCSKLVQLQDKAEEKLMSKVG